MDAALQKKLDAALMDARRLQSLLESTQDFILLLDPDGLIQFVSPSIRRFLGGRRALPKRSNIFGYLHPEDHPLAQLHFKRCLSKPDAKEESELRLVMADGSSRLMACSFHNKMSDPAVKGLVVHAREVTAQRTAMASIHKLYHALEHSPVSILITDAKGIIDYANPAFFKMMGYHAEDVLGQSLKSLKSDLISEQVFMDLWDAIHAGLIWQGCLQSKRKNGECFWHETIVAPIRDEQGAITHFMDIQQDLSTRKKDSLEIARLNRRYQTFLDSTNEGIVGLDSFGRIMVANGAAEKLLHFDQGQLLGNLGETIFHLEEENGQSPILMTLKDGQTRKGQVDLFRRRDQSHVWVEYSCSKLELSEDEEGCIVIFRDISAERQTQVELVHLSATLETRNWELVEARDRALEASRMRTGFLAGVTHELRTPLNAILGMTGLLCRGTATPEQRELLETIQNAGATLLHLVNNLLDFASLEEVRMRLDNMNFEAWRFFEDCTGLFVNMAQNTGIELVCHLDPALPPSLMGDPHRLRQVVTNLLGNAIKFTLQGFVMLAVQVESQDDKSVKLRIDIQDSGIGIAHEAKKKLFQPFTQAENSISRKFGGSGLGLAICRQLVELMGGELWLESEFGKGSCFSIRLTLERTEGAQTWPADPQLSGKRAFLDMKPGLTLRSLTTLLRSLGMRTVRNAAHADLIILGPERRPAPSEKKGPPIVQISPSLQGNAIDGSLRLPLRRGILRRVLASVLSGEQALDHGTTKPLEQCPKHKGRRPDLHTPCVLVVDDSLPNLKLLQALLWEANFNAELAENGQIALEKLKKQNFSLILMDCQMPDMDGPEVAKRFRSCEGPGKRTPIIAVTANTTASIRKQCLDAGMDDILTKPIEQDKLLDALKRWVKGEGTQSTHAENEPVEAAQEPASTKEPVLDLKAADSLRNLPGSEGKNLFFMVSQLYLQDLDARTDWLMKSLDAGASSDLVQAAHLLRGSSANVGLKALSTLCKQLEVLGQENRMGEAVALKQQFKDLVLRSRQVLDYEKNN